MKGKARGHSWHCGEFCMKLLLCEWCVSKRSVRESKQKDVNISYFGRHSSRGSITHHQKGTKFRYDYTRFIKDNLLIPYM